MTSTFAPSSSLPSANLVAINTTISGPAHAATSGWHGVEPGDR